MANCTTQSETQGYSEPYLITDDARNAGRMLYHLAHLVERIDVERDQDSVGRAQPHAVPSRNRRLREPAIGEPAAFVWPWKIRNCGHDRSEDSCVYRNVIRRPPFERPRPKLFSVAGHVHP